MLPFIDDLIEAQKGIGRPGGAPPKRVMSSGAHGYLSGEIRCIAELQCDGAVIFTKKGESPHSEAYLYYLAGIPFRAGISSEFSGGVLSHWEKPLPNTHPVDRHLCLVASIGIPRAGRHLELKTPPEANEEADQAVTRLGLQRKHFVLFLIQKASGYDLPRKVSKSIPVAVAADNTLFVIREGAYRAETVYGGGAAIDAALMERAALAVTDRPLDAYVAEAVRCPVRFLSQPRRKDTETGNRHFVRVCRPR